MHCFCSIVGRPLLHRKPTLKGVAGERLPPALRGWAGSWEGGLRGVLRVQSDRLILTGLRHSGSGTLAGLPRVPTLHCLTEGPRTLGFGAMGLRDTLSCPKGVALGTCTIRISLEFILELKDIGRGRGFGLRELPISTFPGPDPLSFHPFFNGLCIFLGSALAQSFLVASVLNLVFSACPKSGLQRLGV